MTMPTTTTTTSSSLLLLCLLALAGSVLAGNTNTTCEPLEKDDSQCGFLAPLTSRFFKNQAEILSDKYLRMMKAACNDIMSVKDVFPITFCLGAIGPCNGANFSLPEVNPDGSPKDLGDAATFYNQARFGQIMPAFKANNIVPPCYESCRKSVQAVMSCPALAKMGFDMSTDACGGLPSKAKGEACAEFPGKHPSLQKADSKATATEEKKSNDAFAKSFSLLTLLLTAFVPFFLW